MSENKNIVFCLSSGAGGESEGHIIIKPTRSECEILPKIRIKLKVIIRDVVEYEFKRKRGRKGRVHSQDVHTIIYDGHRKKFYLEKEYPIGSQFHIQYLPSSPKTSRIVNPDEGLFSTFFFRFFVIFGLIIMVVFGFLSSMYLKELKI